MDTNITHEYHGTKITFDEKREEWKIVKDGKEQRHKSLQIVKNYIDRANKKAFKRVPVFVQKGSYFSSAGYDEAEITSVGVDGTVFVVKKGEKHASHCGTAYKHNAANAKKVAEIDRLQKIKDDAEEALREAKNSLERVDFDALRKQALGEKE